MASTDTATASLRDFVATSVPDPSPGPSTYKGPPIGYAAKIVFHATNPIRMYGNFWAPRPLFFQFSEKEPFFAGFPEVEEQPADSAYGSGSEVENVDIAGGAQIVQRMQSEGSVMSMWSAQSFWSEGSDNGDSETSTESEDDEDDEEGGVKLDGEDEDDEDSEEGGVKL